MMAAVEDPIDDQAPSVLDTAAAGGLVMRGALLRLGGFALGSLLAALSAILLTRHLGVVRFGQYAAIVAVGTLVAQLAEGGLTTLASRDFAIASPARRTRLLSDRLGLQVVSTLGGTAVCGIFGVLAGYGSGRIWALLAAGLGLGLAAVQVTVAVPLLNELRLGLTTGLELLRQCVLVGLTVTLVLLGAGLVPFLVALIPSSVVALVPTWIIARRAVPFKPRLNPQAWAALVRPALVVSLSSGVATLYVFATQILTSLSASPVQNGLFAASLRVFSVIASVPGLMVTTALPLLSRAARDDADRLSFALDRLFAAAFVTGVGVGLTLLLGAQPIIAVIGGGRYAGSVGALRIEGAAVLGTCLSPVWSSGLLAMHRHVVLLGCNILSLAVTVTATLLLAPSLGAEGSAIAVVVGEWTVAISLLVAIGRARREVLPTRAGALLGRVALAGGAAAAVMLVGLPGVAQLCVGLVVFSVLVLATRAFPQEVLELLPERVRQWHRQDAAGV